MLNKVYIGNKIRKFRQENHFSLQYLAEQSDISLPYLSHVEHGKHMPTLDVLVRLMNALHINYSILTDETQEDNIITNSILNLLQHSSEEEFEFFLYILEIIKESEG